MKRKNPEMKVEVNDEELAKLPGYVIRMAVLHAKNHAKYVLNLSEDDPKYVSAVEKEAERYLREGIKESLTPHMDDGMNPTTPIAEDVFSLSPVFSIDGTFFKKIDDSAKKEDYHRQLRAAVNTLAGIYAVVMLRLQKKDYAIEKGANTDQKRNTKLNQYKRVFLVDSITSMLEPLFRVNPTSMDEFLVSGLKSDNLSDPKVREDFIKKVRAQITKEGFNAESLKKIF